MNRSMNSMNSMIMNWDSNDDGVMGTDDILAAFDSNRDGVIDGNELEALTSQLSRQLDYTNALLERMSELENAHSKQHAELHHQQGTIKNLANQLEALKSELSESNRKLKVSQDIADNLSRQLRECRIESSIIKKDAEDAKSRHIATAEECDDLKREYDDLLFQLQNYEKRNISLVDQYEKYKMESETRYESLKITYETHHKELLELRGKQMTNDIQCNDTEESLKAITKSFDELHKQHKEEQAIKQQMEMKIRTLHATIESKQQKYTEKEMQCNEYAHQFESLSRKMQDCVNEKELCEQRISKMEEALMEHQFMIKNLNEDKMHMKNHVDKLKMEHLNALKKQKLEHDKQIESLMSKQSDMSLLMEESKVHYEDSIEAAQQKLIDIYKLKGAADEHCARYREQYEHLEGTIHNMTSQHKYALGQYETKVEGLENSVHGLQQALDTANGDKDRSVQQLAAERDELRHTLEVEKLRQQDNNVRYIEMFTNIQGTVQALVQEAAAGRNKVRELTNQLSLLSKRQSLLDSSSAANLTALQGELSSAFSVLLQKKSQAREREENMMDEMRKLQLAKEEEVSRCLMLEEQISRVEHEAASTKKKVGQVEKEGAYQMKKQQLLGEKLRSDKVQLEERLHIAAKQHAEAQEKIRRLQDGLHNMESTLDGVHMKHTVTGKDKDSKLAMFSQQLSKIQEEKEAESHRCQRLTHTVNQLLAEMEEMKRAVSVSYDQVDRMKKEHHDMGQRVSMASLASKDTSNQYETQLKQHQELLRNIQAQKAELQAQNASLRSELNSLYAKAK